MKQAAEKMKMSMKNVNITANNVNASEMILKTMLLSFVGLAFAYMLILGNMIFDIAERKVLEKEARDLATEVAELELSYLSLTDTIDADLSKAMGFRETQATFATRKSLGSLSLASNEI